jgi:mono/diheme cytochrome c family protein
MNGGKEIMRVLSIVMALLGALALASTAAAADLELGKKVYTAKCAACHGADGKGNAKMAATLKVTIPELSAATGKTDAELLKLLSEGKKPMPSFAKSLGKDETDAVLSYAKALAKGAGGK